MNFAHIFWSSGGGPAHVRGVELDDLSGPFQAKSICDSTFSDRAEISISVHGSHKIKRKGCDEIHNKIVQAGSAIQEKVTPSWNLGRRWCFFPLGPSQLANICSPCLHRAGDPTAAALWGLSQPAACICFSFSYSPG